MERQFGFHGKIDLEVNSTLGKIPVFKKFRLWRNFNLHENLDSREISAFREVRLRAKYRLSAKFAHRQNLDFELFLVFGESFELDENLTLGTISVSKDFRHWRSFSLGLGLRF